MKRWDKAAGRTVKFKRWLPYFIICLFFGTLVNSCLYQQYILPLEACCLMYVIFARCWFLWEETVTNLTNSSKFQIFDWKTFLHLLISFIWLSLYLESFLLKQNTETLFCMELLLQYVTYVNFWVQIEIS